MSAAESALLAPSNQVLPAALRERIAYLRARREAESITDAEYGELTRLTARAEELHADRMAALVELAKCRGVSLAVLLDKLRSHFPEHVGTAHPDHAQPRHLPMRLSGLGFVGCNAAELRRGVDVLAAILSHGVIGFDARAPHAATQRLGLQHGHASRRRCSHPAGQA